MTFEIGSISWIEENNRTLTALQLDPNSLDFDAFRITVSLVSPDSPGSPSNFTLELSGNCAKLMETTNPSDITIRIDKTMAARINQGTITVAMAISNGDIKVSGNIAKLIESSAKLSIFARALKQLQLVE